MDVVCRSAKQPAVEHGGEGDHENGEQCEPCARCQRGQSDGTQEKDGGGLEHHVECFESHDGRGNNAVRGHRVKGDGCEGMARDNHCDRDERSPAHPCDSPVAVGPKGHRIVPTQYSEGEEKSEPDEDRDQRCVGALGSVGEESSRMSTGKARERRCRTHTGQEMGERFAGDGGAGRVVFRHGASRGQAA